jgi:hypothetical protein
MAASCAVIRQLILAILGVLCLIAPRAANATPDLPVVCERAGDRAARATGVPVSVMRAIAIAETGRKLAGALRPWPWTVNMEGTGVWFNTEAEAQSYAQTHLSAGSDSFDVGCFQLNYRWHGQAFASLAAMFDPVQNALYAARFLRSLYDEYGDWTAAAGAYHSRNPTYAGPYRERFQAIRAAYLSQDGSAPPVLTAQNTPSTSGRDLSTEARVINADYPLLQTGAVSDLGSLVPLNAGAPRPFFAPSDPKG